LLLQPTNAQIYNTKFSLYIMFTATCFELTQLNEAKVLKLPEMTEMAKHVGKAVPLQAWSSLEGSRKLRFPDFMKTAQDGGKVVSLTHQPPLPPGNTPGTHFY